MNNCSLILYIYIELTCSLYIILFFYKNNNMFLFIRHFNEYIKKVTQCEKLLYIHFFNFCFFVKLFDIKF